MAGEGRTPMGSEPSGPYRVETFTMDDMEYASVVGPNGFSESWATAADRAHEAARLMNIACASGDAAGYERGVREEREACAVVVDALATRLATTVHECSHELGLPCAVCYASREAHATVSALRARGAAQPPVQGDGKGGA